MPDTPALARTAFVVNGDEERSRAAGCDGYEGQAAAIRVVAAHERGLDRSDAADGAGGA
jgi:hypothetical protein